MPIPWDDLSRFPIANRVTRVERAAGLGFWAEKAVPAQVVLRDATARVAPSTLGEPLRLTHVGIRRVFYVGGSQLPVWNDREFAEHSRRRVERGRAMRREQGTIHLVLALLKVKTVGDKVVVVAVATGFARADWFAAGQHVLTGFVFQHNLRMGQLGWFRGRVWRLRSLG